MKIVDSTKTMSVTPFRRPNF